MSNWLRDSVRWIVAAIMLAPAAHAQEAGQENNNAQQQQQQSAQQQPQQILLPARPPGPRPAQRYEIDAKRTGTTMESDDALPRSREFLRIDSTYYVGWLYQGAYLYNHAADYVGFKNAIVPLERALRVIERDYRRDLATRTQDIMTFIPVFSRQVDYAQIVRYLNQAYLNTDQPDKSFALCRRYLKWNFQREFFDAYNYMMWVTHRNRFYTKEKYAFLGNSIDENETLAAKYLDSALRRITINARYNARIFPPGYEKDERLGVYHYKSMLYAYALKIDLAEKAFGMLRNTLYFPHNNYATFRSICGDFREAEREYKIAAGVDGGDKRLQEWAYYTSILQIYKGYPKWGELQMKEMIAAVGSTPGFGWYNIALARCLFYDGQIAESEKYDDKAAIFKELHIGTTLGQSHYDFSVQLNRLMTKNARYEMQRFEHRNWWYNPAVLWKMSTLQGDRYLQQFLIINQFSQNPERDRVIYKIFSTESTISWDEVYFLVHDLGPKFFIKRFQNEAAKDPRKAVQKYFRLFIARLKVTQGDYKEATVLLQQVLSDPTIDLTYEKLFIARTFEALAEAADGQDKKDEQQEWLNRMYKVYPQLIPYSGLRFSMNLQVLGTPDKEALARLKNCNINWDGSANAPRAVITFSQKDKTKLVEYFVVSSNGEYIVPRQVFSYKNAAGGGVALAYRLFGIGGAANRQRAE